MRVFATLIDKESGDVVKMEKHPDNLWTEWSRKKLNGTLIKYVPKDKVSKYGPEILKTRSKEEPPLTEEDLI